MQSFFNNQSSDTEDKEEISVAAECSFTESDKEEVTGTLANEFKGKWKIDFGF